MQGAIDPITQNPYLQAQTSLINKIQNLRVKHMDDMILSTIPSWQSKILIKLQSHQKILNFVSQKIFGLKIVYYALPPLESDIIRELHVVYKHNKELKRQEFRVHDKRYQEMNGIYSYA